MNIWVCPKCNHKAAIPFRVEERPYTIFIGCWDCGYIYAIETKMNTTMTFEVQCQ